MMPTDSVSSPDPDGLLPRVDAFFAALERGDIDSCETLFTDDAIIWHNYDQQEQPKSVALAELGAIVALRPRFAFVGRDVIGQTCVQRHTVTVSLPEGREFSIPAIQRIQFAGSRIERIDEYLDSSQLAIVAQALQYGENVRQPADSR